MHELWSAFKRIRGWPWLLCAAAVGILLMLFSDDLCGGTATETYPASVEHRIAQMTQTLPGVEDVSVLVTFEEDGSAFSVYSDPERHGQICGIAVTCIGGNDARIRLQILEMLCTAYGLTADRVWVGGKEALVGP